MDSHAREGGRRQEREDFHQEVRNEFEVERKLLEDLARPRRWEWGGHVVAVLLLMALVVLIFADYRIFFLWIIAALLLYSYNFILILIPTTTARIRPEEKTAVDRIEQKRKWLAIKLLVKNRRLAVDVGLTVFLCGMAPLTVSFSIIFGLTLALTVYLGVVVQFLTYQEVWSLLLRLGFILFFYTLVVLLRPQSRGVVGGPSPRNGKMRLAGVQGQSAFLIVMMVLVSMVLATTVLRLGTSLIPVINLPEIYDALSALDLDSALTLAFILTCMLVTMRHFQGVASQKMAVNIVTARLDRLGNQVLRPLEAMTLGPDHDGPGLDKLKREFYSLAIYDIGEHDIFGRSPVFLIGPRLRYILDDRVLAYLE